MPTSRKTKHGSGKPHRPKPLTYDPVYTDGLTDDLRAALKSKLTLKELVDLEAQLRKAVEQTARRAARKGRGLAFACRRAGLLRDLCDGDLPLRRHRLLQIWPDGYV